MPTLDYEISALQDNFRAPAGLDEAGRGALAGPVTAGAVILPLQDEEALLPLRQVNDSKQLTFAQRDNFFELIVTTAAAWGIGSASAAEIDAHGILPATRLAMRRALAQLTPGPDYLLIDGRLRLSTVNLPQRSIIRGDTLSLSIAAASILAKVSRDREMIAVDQTYPAYRFARHKGYGTLAHRQAIAQHGATPIHRRSFSPFRQLLLG